MASIILFCEGTEESNKSYDRQILKKILPSVTVQTFGGKMGYKQYKLAYLQMNKGLFDKAYIFRDRDFDFDFQHLEKAPHLIPALIQAKQNEVKESKEEFASFRTCIENYMLDIGFFFSFLEAKYPARNFLQTITEIEELYRDAAKEIRYYSAMRHALGFVRKPFPFLKTKPENEKGQDTTFKNYEKLTCQKEMHAYFHGFYMKIPYFSAQELNEKFEFFCERFEQENFYNDQQYLIWFNGKELMRQINQKLKKAKIELSLQEDYFSWLMDNQTKDMWLKFEDLKELVELMK